MTQTRDASVLAAPRALDSASALMYGAAMTRLVALEQRRVSKSPGLASNPQPSLSRSWSITLPVCRPQFMAMS